MLIIFLVAIVFDMAQQDFDNFKQQIKDWMDAHPEEYDCFEEEMNRKDNAGYQQILRKAFSLVPKYQKIIRKRVNQVSTEDISDIETLFSANNLAESLINEFEKSSPESIVPAMLSWLYFGKSFERMVERGEEIRRNPETTFAERIVILPIIKLVIARSISLGLRTKTDWEKHREFENFLDECAYGLISKTTNHTLCEELFEHIVDDIIGRLETTKNNKSKRRQHINKLIDLCSTNESASLERYRDHVNSKLKIGKHGQQEIERLLTKFGFGSVLESPTMSEFFQRFNSLNNIRNNIVPEDATPSLTHTDVQNYLSVIDGFVQEIQNRATEIIASV
ncbi:DUF6043 family protein [Massilibacteroides vaginae]|uniref:DUF6043 family protein n=1 Tax=Massilibacteroides vaginae TaxID=1673718 RepID=UPI000A1CAF8C|nr:DUF6043 family protein [Massilibacteroides vaginae]